MKRTGFRPAAAVLAEVASMLRTALLDLTATG